MMHPSKLSKALTRLPAPTPKRKSPKPIDPNAAFLVTVEQNETFSGFDCFACRSPIHHYEESFLLMIDSGMRHFNHKVCPDCKDLIEDDPTILIGRNLSSPGYLA